MGSEFYQCDKQLGSVCTINGKSAYDLFNADLVQITPTVGSISSDVSRATGGSSLHVASYEFGMGGIKATFYVGGEYKEDCYINTSNLIAECRQCIIRTDDDGFEYVAVLTACSVNETGVDFYNEVELTFKSIRRLPMVTKVLDGGSGTFHNVGSIESGLQISITPKSDMGSVVVNGITVSNLTANVPFVIDGISGKIECNGINRFLDTDLISFPKAYPGLNTVEASSADITVTVSYYPTFLV